ncbi:FadR/GntR family transcriptional regulator [Shouchella clausii]|uniref:FadR/GntR family transcriptional regulator n=1 Tax=Shouchella clausii TaxID=79880 RepID=UPI000BA62AFC|nr:FadR/GntR family transcriptional regulator [Shouchella clausii]PAD16195.1 GntR family transcriptional regulator [Shouchella clausii]
MTFNSYNKTDVVTHVYEQLKDKILVGEWKPKSKLPSEWELANMFNVSRVSVRSAIQKLRDIGLVVTFQGKGSFVSQNVNRFGLNDFGIIMHLSQKEFLDMMVFRETIEFKCLELAAEKATDADFEEIEQALEKMEQSTNNYREYSEADYQFHLAVVKTSKNKLFYDTFLLLKDAYYYYLEELNRVIGVTEESKHSHYQILTALKSRDAMKAKKILSEAMQRNIEIMTNHGEWKLKE